MGRLGREVASILLFALATGVLIALHPDWEERAAFACAFGAFLLLMTLRELRKDDPPDSAWSGVLLAVAILAASVLIGVFVVHSWAWLGLAAAIFLVAVGLEAWDWYVEQRPPKTGEIQRDIEEKQHRQDELIEKTFFHP